MRLCGLLGTLLCEWWRRVRPADVESDDSADVLSYAVPVEPAVVAAVYATVAAPERDADVAAVHAAAAATFVPGMAAAAAAARSNNLTRNGNGDIVDGEICLVDRAPP